MFSSFSSNRNFSCITINTNHPTITRKIFYRVDIRLLSVDIIFVRNLFIILSTDAYDQVVSSSTAPFVKIILWWKWFPEIDDIYKFKFIFHRLDITGIRITKEITIQLTNIRVYRISIFLWFILSVLFLES